VKAGYDGKPRSASAVSRRLQILAAKSRDAFEPRRLKPHRAAHGLAALHQFERVVDLVKRHHMRNHRIDGNSSFSIFRYVISRKRPARSAIAASHMIGHQCDGFDIRSGGMRTLEPGHWPGGK
jgi:hypothetical protein